MPSRLARCRARRRSRPRDSGACHRRAAGSRRLGRGRGLPFGLGRQAPPGPAAPRIGLVPVDVDDGPVRLQWHASGRSRARSQPPPPPRASRPDARRRRCRATASLRRSTARAGDSRRRRRRRANSAWVTGARAMRNGATATGCAHFSLSKTKGALVGASRAGSVPPGTRIPGPGAGVAGGAAAAVEARAARIAERLARIGEGLVVHVLVKRRELV